MANTPNIVRAIGNQLGTTLNAGISSSASSITLVDATGFSTDGGYIIIDENITGKEEIVYVTGVAGSTLTVATDGRGRCGTSATSHDAGATVSDILVDEHINGIADKFIVEHNDDGTHVADYATITGSENLTNKTITLPVFTNGAINFNAPQGFLINGKIDTSVASNNITVSIKTLAGGDPSASDPVYCRIGDSIQGVTAALSVTKNAGTNWFGSGDFRSATYERDYFVYLGYNATDGVTLGFALIPYARVYGDFSATTTSENYCAINNIANASATDNYEVIGRFNATLSAGASYNWSIPATSIIINRPIFETRTLTYLTDIYGGTSAGTTTWSSRTSHYKISGRDCQFSMYSTWTNQTGSGDMYIYMPRAYMGISGSFFSFPVAFATGLTDPGKWIGGLAAHGATAFRLVNASGAGSSYYAIDTAGSIITSGIYSIV
jgi:hypothetical protein